MNNYPSAIQTLRWLRKNRIQKKRKLNKQGFSVLFDLTTFIYGLAFFLVFVIYFLNNLAEMVPFLSLFMLEPYTWIFTIFVALIIKSLIGSFRSSGVYITSAEYQLTVLPYKIETIWLFCLLERVVKVTVRALIMFGILFILFPAHTSIVLNLVFAIWIGNLFGIGIEWRLFQIGGLRKLLYVFLPILLLIGFRYLVYYFQLPSRELLFGSLIIAILLTIYLFFYYPLKKVDWGKVVAFGDVKTWNLFLVQQITKQQIKPPTKFQLLHKVFRGKRAKRPYPYKLSAVSVRLWLPFLKDNTDILLRTIGVFFLFVIGFGLLGEIQLQIALAFSVLAVNAVISSLFVAFFQTPLLKVLPWRFGEWYQSFRRWYIVFIFLYGIAAGIMLYVYNMELYWLVLLLIFYCCWLLVDLDHTVQARQNALNKKEWNNGGLFITRIIGAIVIFFSIPYPWISILGLFFIIGLKYKRIKNESTEM